MFVYALLQTSQAWDSNVTLENSPMSAWNFLGPSRKGEVQIDIEIF